DGTTKAASKNGHHGARGEEAVEPIEHAAMARQDRGVILDAGAALDPRRGKIAGQSRCGYYRGEGRRPRRPEPGMMAKEPRRRKRCGCADDGSLDGLSGTDRRRQFRTAQQLAAGLTEPVEDSDDDVEIRDDRRRGGPGKP